MIAADKVLIIQDLQCKHATWLADYNMAIGLNMCVETWATNNIFISNLIDTIYRYKTFDATVTNADIVEISVATTDILETYSIDIDYGATNLVTYSGTGTQATVVTAVCDAINADTATHKYYCVKDGNQLYLYTYDGTATYADTPTLTFSELDLTTVELNVTTEALTDQDLGVILDTWNCLTLDNLCYIVTKIKSLLKNCNCN